MESLEDTVTMELHPSEVASPEVNPDDTIKEETILTNVAAKLEDCQTEILAWKCFICDAQLTTENSCSVFYTMLSNTGVQLQASLNKVLRTRFEAPHTMRSPVVCTECFNIFDELEVAEQKCRQLREKIVSGYKKTCELYNQMDLAVDIDGVSCQTEDVEYVDYLDRSNLTETPDQSINIGKVVVRLSSSRPKRKSKAKKRKTKEIDEDMDPPLELEVEHDSGSVGESANSDQENTEEPIHIDYKNYEEMIKSEPNVSDEENPKTSRSCRRKMHSCDFCPRKFRRPGELKNHLLVTHMDRNPNHCSMCGRKFNSRNGLYVHLKKIHHVDYADRKQLAPDLFVDVNLLSIEPESAGDTSNVENVGIEEAEDPHNSEIEEDGDNAERDADGSDSDWTEEVSQKCRTQRSPRAKRARSCSRNRTEKENEIHLDRVKLEEEEEEGKELDEEEEQGEGEVKQEMESGGEGGGDRRRKNRGTRVGERATMPLVHECPTCGKKWRTVSELNAHILTHSDLRPFVCEICGQGYKLRKALDIHVGMHNGVHPFTCHFCNKSFTQKIGLQKHLPIHTGIARYQCDLCGKQFIHQKSFQIHKMVHSGEKSVRCPICNMALLSSSHLRRHMRVHTGEKPYECSTCGKRFAERYNLNAHQKVHLPPGAVTKERSKTRRPTRGQKCQVCDFTSTRRVSLTRHWETEHPHLIPAQDHGYSHNSLSNQTDPLLPVGADRLGLVPQMIIDPSGSISYEEKPAFYQHPDEVPNMMYK